MRPNISITLITPHVTIERYSELTGLFIDTINDMLADGRLLRHRLRKDKKREKVMINIAAMTVDALSDCNVTIWWEPMKTYWFSIGPMPTAAMRSVPQRRSGSGYSAEWHHSPCSWPKGGQISTPKCR